jgi:hypothetical protein
MADPCIYVKDNSDSLIAITIYVNDCIIISPSQHLQAMKKLLTNCFKITDLGLATSMLSIKLTHDHELGTLCL